MRHCRIGDSADFDAVSRGSISVGLAFDVADADEAEFDLRLRLRAGSTSIDGAVTKACAWIPGPSATSPDPLCAHYHRGPLNSLSNYTQRQDSINVGLRFAQPF